MNAVIWERSMLSGEGSQRSSLLCGVVASSTAALISPAAPPDVAVEQADEVEREAMRALERLGVDAVGHVEVRVPARDMTLGRQAGDRRRAVAARAREHAVAAVAVAQRAGPRAVAVGRRDRLAEPDEVAVHREGHDPARSGFV